MGLEISNLSIWYKQRSQPTLKDINLRVNLGSSTIITGKMGSGKSTLFLAISKMFNPGTLKSANGTISGGLPIIYISQRIAPQILTFNVTEELATKLSFQNIKRKDRLIKVNKILNDYNLLTLTNRNTRKLSSGQQQLIIILANVIDIKDNFVLLMDEPLSLLDNPNIILTLNLIEILVKGGHAVIIADPRPKRYDMLRPKYFQLSDGRLSEYDRKEEKFEFELENKNKFEDTLSPLNLEIGYDKIIQSVNLLYPQNGLMIITGDNGSGKTALLLTLAKIIKPLKSQQLELEFPDAIFLPQDSFSFFFRSTVEEELLSVATPENFPLWVQGHLKFSPFLLSEGQRKKLGLELCFMQNRVLLLDEPTQALDFDTVQWLLQKIQFHCKQNLVIIASNDQVLVNILQSEAHIINF